MHKQSLLLLYSLHMNYAFQEFPCKRFCFLSPVWVVNYNSAKTERETLGRLQDVVFPCLTLPTAPLDTLGGPLWEINMLRHFVADLG